jgi:hypothetical protein
MAPSFFSAAWPTMLILPTSTRATATPLSSPPPRRLHQAQTGASVTIHRPILTRTDVWPKHGLAFGA